MFNNSSPSRSETGQVEADIYFCCSRCTFPRTQRPPEPGELIVTLEAPDAEAEWLYYCTECRYPLDSLPEKFQGRIFAIPLPEGMNRGGSSGYTEAQSSGEEEDTPLPRDYRPVRPNADELDPPPQYILAPPYIPLPPYPGLLVCTFLDGNGAEPTQSPHTTEPTRLDRLLSHT